MLPFGSQTTRQARNTVAVAPARGRTRPVRLEVNFRSRYVCWNVMNAELTPSETIIV